MPAIKGIKITYKKSNKSHKYCMILGEQWENSAWCLQEKIEVPAYKGVALELKELMFS